MTKHIIIGVRVTPEEKEMVRQTAAMYEMSLSQFVLAFTRYVREVRPHLVITPVEPSKQVDKVGA